MLDKGLDSPLGSKEIKPINPKGNQSWIFTGRSDAETPILLPPDAKSWLIGKDPDSWERLKAGREAGDKGWDGWMASPTQWTGVWTSSRRWQDREARCAAFHGVAKNQTRPSNWTITIPLECLHRLLSQTRSWKVTLKIRPMNLPEALSKEWGIYK